MWQNTDHRSFWQHSVPDVSPTRLQLQWRLWPARQKTRGLWCHWSRTWDPCEKAAQICLETSILLLLYHLVYLICSFCNTYFHLLTWSHWGSAAGRESCPVFLCVGQHDPPDCSRLCSARCTSPGCHPQPQDETESDALQSHPGSSPATGRRGYLADVLGKEWTKKTQIKTMKMNFTLSPRAARSLSKPSCFRCRACTLARSWP